MFREFQYDSCGSGKIHVSLWEPDGDFAGIIQIVHGLAEHSKRYDDFANYLNKQGFLVIAEDHMGHGKSAKSKDKLGQYTGGWFSMVKDTYKLMEEIRGEFPDKPYILFGHSMGSFIVRTILEKYPVSGASAAILCGTAWPSTPILKSYVELSRLICKTTHEKQPSSILQKVLFGSYNHRVERPRTAYDWISRVSNEVDAFIGDPLCGFDIPSCLAREILLGLSFTQSKENLEKMNKDLPVFFISGGDDPVGGYGNGVRKAAEMFKKAGMKDVSTRIYPLCRHEILNEMNRNDVYGDIVRWIRHKI